MAFVLIIVGVFFLVAAVRNTQSAPANPNLFGLLQGEFTGKPNFIYWFVAILLIGAVGYIPKLKPVSIAFMTLVVIVLVFTKGNPSAPGGGLFQQLTTALQTTTTTSQVTQNGTTTTQPTTISPVATSAADQSRITGGTLFNQQPAAQQPAEQIPQVGNI